MILSKYFDFQGQKLFDVGFGHGDLLRAAHDAGAIVYGCEIDRDLIDRIVPGLEGAIFESDIDTWDDTWYPFKGGGHRGQGKSIDILTCFSVLPYLRDPSCTIRYFAKISKVSVIEMQYRGDGPGHLIRNFLEMENWLKEVWEEVKWIGQTYIKDRDKHRDIWLCQ